MRAKPYPRYKPSGVDWLGDVPEHWAIKPLKVAVRLTDKKREVDEEKAMPYVALEHIESWTGRLHPLNQDLQPSGIANQFRAGNVLFGKLRPYLARACRPYFDGLCSSELLVLDGRELKGRFLLYAVLTTGFVRDVDSSTYGAKMPRAGWDFIGNCRLPVPPAEDQDSIADFLDGETAKIDALMAKKRTLIHRLKEKRVALISHTVTRGLPPTTARAAGLNPHPSLKDSRIDWLGDIPEHWRILPVKSLAKSGRKSFTDGDWIELPFITDESVRLIQTGNIGIGAYKEQGFRYVSDETFNELGCTGVEPNDVLICRLDGPVGRACLAPDLGLRMITSVDNTILKVRKGISPNFVVYLLSSAPWLSWIDAVCRVGGGFRMRVSRTMLGNIRVPLPPSSEQSTIVEYLDRETAKIDRMVSRVEEAIERLHDYRAALITAAVTGKIDVRVGTVDNRQQLASTV